MVLSACSNKAEFASWFGRFITDNRNDYEQDQEIIGEAEFYKHFNKAKHINRYGNIRMSYIEDGDIIKLFCAGNEISLPKLRLPLIQYLCSKHQLECPVIMKFCDKDNAMSFLYTLYKDGYLYFDG